MRSFLDRWARKLVRRGLRTGLIEGSNLWLSIGAVAWLLRFLSRRDAPQVSSLQLRLGEAVVVTHLPAPPSTRRQRKKAARHGAEREQQTETRSRGHKSRRAQRRRPEGDPEAAE